MSSKEIAEFLHNLELCEICVLRYTDKYTFNPNQNTSENAEIDHPKKKRTNYCVACLGLFEGIDFAADEIVTKSNLASYDSKSLYTSINVPIALLIRELSIWIALINRFPGSIDCVTAPNISIKDAFKQMFNDKLCKKTNRVLELHQNGVLVNLFYDYEFEQEEIEKLFTLKPKSLHSICDNKKVMRRNMSRNFFEKHYFPSNLDLDACRMHLPVPPEISSSPIKLGRYSIQGPQIFFGGRYRKISRDLSQTPWVLNGVRMKEDSVQEIICKELCPYFDMDVQEQNEKVIFMGSGREDVDVRCLGKGRPFVLQISDAKKTSLPKDIANEMEKRIDESDKISVHCMQLVNRDDVSLIKEGEEQKKKMYRALCILNVPATIDIMNRLNIPSGFTVLQKTPLRVLHRRPLLTRPRQIFSVKAYIHEKNPKIIIIDVTTQAGAYIKELIHGEFGRTSPSLSSIIGQDIDIISLDVIGIDLNWPPKHEF